MEERIKIEDDEQFLLLVSSYLSRDDKIVTNLANLSSLIYYYLDDISWCGFYLLEDDHLYLGPFQGKSACTKIKLGKGVCGTAYEKNETIIVDDVNSFPGHIACDSESRSEIVVPIPGFGVLDLDSTRYSRFTNRERELLNKVVEALKEIL